MIFKPWLFIFLCVDILLPCEVKKYVLCFQESCGHQELWVEKTSDDAEDDDGDDWSNQGGDKTTVGECKIVYECRAMISRSLVIKYRLEIDNDWCELDSPERGEEEEKISYRVDHP